MFRCNDITHKKYNKKLNFLDKKNFHKSLFVLCILLFNPKIIITVKYAL